MALVALAAASLASPAVAQPGDPRPAPGTSVTAVATASGPAIAARRVDPRRTRGLFVDPLMPAAKAGDRFARIGTKAQALWITDYYSTDHVRADVRAYVDRANQADKTPVLSIYAIPGRDCGLYSSGGLPDGPSYEAWIREVAAGLKDAHAMVVLEPDAVPFMGDPRCTDSTPRQELLTDAAQLLKRAGAWVYLDAGHSGWRSPEVMAPLLKKSGMRYARGFSTNVGNFRHTGAERDYAKRLVKELRKLGIKGKHYLTETARNGGRKPVEADVCNPTWARVGRAPKLLFKKGGKYGPLDGYLWIKHPGESDGQSSDTTCHGGPPSGEWWPKGAKRLLRSR